MILGDNKEGEEEEGDGEGGEGETLMPNLIASYRFRNRLKLRIVSWEGQISNPTGN